MNELIDRGIPKTQIIYIPLDRRGYKNIKTSEELETKIEYMLGDDENYYLFIDEVQNVFGIPLSINSFIIAFKINDFPHLLMPVITFIISES